MALSKIIIFLAAAMIAAAPALAEVKAINPSPLTARCAPHVFTPEVASAARHAQPQHRCFCPPLHSDRLLPPLLAPFQLSGSSSTPTSSSSPSRHFPTPQTKDELAEVAAQFDIWNDALQTLDSAQVAALYADNGVLLPTLSNEVRYTNDRVANYFDSFLLKLPYGMINESYTRFLDEEKTTAANSGIYTFKLTDTETNTTSYAAGRFTYVYVKDPATGEWKIAEHHSSLLPEVSDPAYDAVYGLIRLWNETLQTGSPDAVVDLYAADSVLLPTQSNVVRDDRAGKIDYFEDFLAKKPWMSVEEEHIRFLDDDKTAAANDGIYMFRLTDKETGEVSEVGARYSFIYRMDEETGEWKIETHHSSALPNDIKEEPFDVDVAEKTRTTAGRKML